MNFDAPKPMIITVKHYGKTLTAELPWDTNLDEIFIAIQGLLVANGFDHNGIENHIVDMSEDIKNNQKYNQNENQD